MSTEFVDDVIPLPLPPLVPDPGEDRMEFVPTFGGGGDRGKFSPLVTDADQPDTERLAWPRQRAPTFAEPEEDHERAIRVHLASIEAKLDELRHRITAQTEGADKRESFKFNGMMWKKGSREFGDSRRSLCKTAAQEDRIFTAPAEPPQAMFVEAPRADCFSVVPLPSDPAPPFLHEQSETSLPSQGRKKTLGSELTGGISIATARVHGTRNRHTPKLRRLDRMHSSRGLDKLVPRIGLDRLYTLAREVKRAEWAQPRERLAKIIHGDRFQTLVSFLILVNACYVGYASERDLKKSLGSNEVEDGQLVETLFVVFFFTELLARIYADRLTFFIGPEHRWNLLDLVLVTLGVSGWFVSQMNTAIPSVATLMWEEFAAWRDSSASSV